MSAPEEGKTGPVIRDLRRIDPETGQVRVPAGGGPARPGAAPAGPGGAAGPARPAAAKAPGAQGQQGGDPGPGASSPAGGQGRAAAAASSAAPAGSERERADRLAERTADLQRVTAEYANYRKRVERDRLAVREQALANVLHALLPVLDDIGRAREHGELVGGFKSVADSLESAVSKLGLVSFGEEGEAFDPKVHEALAHSYSADVTETTCATILQPGYKVGERILRPARVAVTEPEEPAGQPAEADQPPVGEGPGAAAGAGEPGTAHEHSAGGRATANGGVPGSPGPQESRGDD